MTAKAQLAELVNDHLGRNANMSTITLAAVIRGLSLIMNAYNDAKERRGNWAAMLANLKEGRANIEAALPHLRTASAGVEAVIELAERELDFSAEMEDSINRLSAGESTLV
jgi:hypothetical protein